MKFKSLLTNILLALSLLIIVVLTFVSIMNFYYFWQPVDNLFYYVLSFLMLMLCCTGIGVNVEKCLAKTFLPMLILLVVPLLFFNYFTSILLFAFTFIIYIRKSKYFSRIKILVIIIFAVSFICILVYTSFSIMNEKVIKANNYVFIRDLNVSELYIDSKGTKYFRVSNFKGSTDAYDMSYLSVDDVINLEPLGRFYLKEKVVKANHIG